MGFKLYVVFNSEDAKKMSKGEYALWAGHACASFVSNVVGNFDYIPVDRHIRINEVEGLMPVEWRAWLKEDYKKIVLQTEKDLLMFFFELERKQLNLVVSASSVLQSSAHDLKPKCLVVFCSDEVAEKIGLKELKLL